MHRHGETDGAEQSDLGAVSLVAGNEEALFVVGGLDLGACDFDSGARARVLLRDSQFEKRRREIDVRLGSCN